MCKLLESLQEFSKKIIIIRYGYYLLYAFGNLKFMPLRRCEFFFGSNWVLEAYVLLILFKIVVLSGLDVKPTLCLSTWLFHISKCPSQHALSLCHIYKVNQVNILLIKIMMWHATSYSYMALTPQPFCQCGIERFHVIIWGGIATSPKCHVRVWCGIDMSP